MCQISKFLEKEVYPDFPERAKEPKFNFYISEYQAHIPETKYEIFVFH